MEIQKLSKQIEQLTFEIKAVQDSQREVVGEQTKTRLILEGNGVEGLLKQWRRHLAHCADIQNKVAISLETNREESRGYTRIIEEELKESRLLWVEKMSEIRGVMYERIRKSEEEIEERLRVSEEKLAERSGERKAILWVIALVGVSQVFELVSSHGAEILGFFKKIISAIF